MINQKEATSIILVSLVLGLLISLIQSWNAFLYSLLFIFLVIIINIFAKKIMSYQLDSEIKVKLWEIRQWGYKKHNHFKRYFPMGIFLPIIISIISLGYIIWAAVLTFDVKPKKYRAAKRYGLYSFSEITEYHLGLIAASGIVANLLFAILGYLIGFPEFARLNIYYAFFNMIPISNLDGNKIFFGSLVLWSFLAVMVLIALAYAIFLI
jgi:hypothetical protein